MDKGKAQMPEYEDNQFNDNELAHFVDSEFDDFDWGRQSLQNGLVKGGIDKLVSWTLPVPFILYLPNLRVRYEF